MIFCHNYGVAPSTDCGPCKEAPVFIGRAVYANFSINSSADAGNCVMMMSRYGKISSRNLELLVLLLLPRSFCSSCKSQNMRLNPGPALSGGVTARLGARNRIHAVIMPISINGPMTPPSLLFVIQRYILWVGLVKEGEVSTKSFFFTKLSLITKEIFRMLQDDHHIADGSLQDLEHCLAILLAPGDGESNVAKLVPRILKKRHKVLTRNADRAMFAKRLYGASVLRGRLRYIAQELGYGCDPSASLLLRLYLLTEEHLPQDLPAVPYSVSPILAVSSISIRWPTEPVDRLAAQGSLPRWLAALILQELNQDLASALSFASAINQAGPATLRVNTLKASVQVAQDALDREGIQTERRTEGGLSPLALHVVGKANLWGSTSWRQGLFEVQDEGSQYIALATKLHPGQSCLDLCAGRGGKTLALAAMLQNEGRLFVYDVDLSLITRDLKPRLLRAGVDERRVTVGLPGLSSMDVVLVDAPCSSLGTLRRAPDLRWTLRPHLLTDAKCQFDPPDGSKCRFHPADGSQCQFSRLDGTNCQFFLPGLQRELLLQGASHVKEGGRLVYATCSLARAENEAVVESALALLRSNDHRIGVAVQLARQGHFAGAEKKAAIVAKKAELRVNEAANGANEAVIGAKSAVGSVNQATVGISEAAGSANEARARAPSGHTEKARTVFLSPCCADCTMFHSEHMTDNIHLRGQPGSRWQPRNVASLFAVTMCFALTSSSHTQTQKKHVHVRFTHSPALVVLSMHSLCRVLFTTQRASNDIL
eukprot:g59506.t1